MLSFTFRSFSVIYTFCFDFDYIPFAMKILSVLWGTDLTEDSLLPQILLFILNIAFINLVGANQGA